MSKDNRFISIAELAIEHDSIKEIVSAIEDKGFYGWDRFGRYVKVPANPSSRESILLFENLMDEIAESCEADEFDTDYFYKAMSVGLANVCQCGWPESQLPDFETVYRGWKENLFGDSDFKEPKKITLKHSDIKKKDDWYDFIIQAEIQYRKELGYSPTASNLWAYISKNKIHGCFNTFEDNKIEHGGDVLEKENFVKRFKKYFI